MQDENRREKILYTRITENGATERVIELENGERIRETYKDGRETHEWLEGQYAPDDSLSD